MNKKTVTTIIVLVAIIAFIIFTFLTIMKKNPVVLQGEVEAKQFNIASKIPGRVLEVAVKKGQKVKVGDKLGEIYTDNDGISELHFQLWKGGQKLNPESWLAKR